MFMFIFMCFYTNNKTLFDELNNLVDDAIADSFQLGLRLSLLATYQEQSSNNGYFDLIL